MDDVLAVLKIWKHRACGPSDVYWSSLLAAGMKKNEDPYRFLLNLTDRAINEAESRGTPVRE